MTGNLEAQVKRISQTVFVFLFIGAAVWALIKYYPTEFFPITHVEIHANYQHIDKRVLQKKIVPFISDGLFSIDMSEFHTELMQIPWVAKASINRIWPNTIKISLKERKATAVWNDIGLLDQKNDLFHPRRETFPLNLPHLYGPQKKIAIVLKEFKTIQTGLKQFKLYCTELHLTSRGDWQLALNTGVNLFFGQQHLHQRFNRFLKAYPKLKTRSKSRIRYIDLRYQNGMAVAWY